MSRSLAQTIFVIISALLLLTLGCPALRAQAFSNTSVEAEGAAPKSSDAPAEKALADINALVHESDIHGASMHRGLGEYTYTLVKTKRTLNERGKVLRELVQAFEAYPVEGQHVLIQVSENGAPLSPREVAEARRRAADELMKAERDAQKRSENDKPAGTTPAASGDGPGKYLLAGVYGGANGKYANVIIDLSEFLRSCEFSAPRRERVGKRDALALSFRPRADVKFPAHMSFIPKLSGTIWIDVEDRVVMRLEGWPLPGQTAPPAQPTQTTQPIQTAPPAQTTQTAQTAQAASSHDAQAPAQNEAAIIYQQVRLSTGVWVPSLIRMNAGGNAALFNGLNWDVMFEFKDYKRFSTDVRGVELDKPRRSPAERRPF